MWRLNKLKPILSVTKRNIFNHSLNLYYLLLLNVCVFSDNVFFSGPHNTILKISTVFNTLFMLIERKLNNLIMTIFTVILRDFLVKVVTRCGIEEVENSYKINDINHY